MEQNPTENGIGNSSMPKWFDSALPHFVVVQDQSDFSGPGTSRRDPDSGSQTPGSPISDQLITNRQIHPEIRYVFSDDDFDPTLDLLDQQDSAEISVVVDFDPAGENIVGYKSFTSNWQITNVEKASQDATFSESSDNVSLLSIMGASSEIKLPGHAGSEELIAILQARNAQLRNMLAQVDHHPMDQEEDDSNSI